ncbi:MAG: hypothetical protein N3D11_14795 [Candidatus Sumerlaeia bacterium]|nr:hypothetical protein [Candidatus Sumerlaeia bacterium]
MIGILLVIVILFVLAGYYFKGDNDGQKPGISGYMEQSQQAASVYQSTISRARGVAEQENLRVLQAAIDQWAMNHPGERCTFQALQQAGCTIPAPPPGFRFDIDANNQAILVEVQPSGPPLSPKGNAPPPLPNVRR